nr:MAG TPA: hypothetical protein [Caudoviricetes sp.]
MGQRGIAQTKTGRKNCRDFVCGLEPRGRQAWDKAVQKHGDKRRKRCENNGDKKQADRELVVVGRGIRQAVAGKIKIFVKIK